MARRFFKTIIFLEIVKSGALQKPTQRPKIQRLFSPLCNPSNVWAHHPRVPEIDHETNLNPVAYVVFFVGKTWNPTHTWSYHLSQTLEPLRS